MSSGPLHRPTTNGRSGSLYSSSSLGTTPSSDKAEPIANLIREFEANGNTQVQAVADEEVKRFEAAEWKAMKEEEQQAILLQYRLAYLADTEVNWCPALGTVLANDEIVNGVSERGGHPVIRKKMTQWSMRITAYAQRLLDGLQNIDWPQPLKDSQTNWIGRSEGAEVEFEVDGHPEKIKVFTTRPDTLYGVSFMTLAPEHPWVERFTTAEQKTEIDAYVEATAKRSERDRMSDVKTISGAFTGSLCPAPLYRRSHSDMDRRLCAGQLWNRCCDGGPLWGSTRL